MGRVRVSALEAELMIMIMMMHSMVSCHILAHGIRFLSHSWAFAVA